MVERCGINCIKEAVSGTTLADTNETSYVSRLKNNVDKTAKVDLLICQLSTNDSHKKVPLEETEKAIRFIVSYAKETFNCPIAFYNNPYLESEGYKNMVDLLNRLQKELDFAVLDFYNDEEMRKVSDSDRARFMQDRVHPTLEGYAEWWLPKFISFCEEL
jgi:lysophospholipase L1-like esterase